MGSELDVVLGVIGNSVRRRIIKRLSQESSYPLELSNDLGVNQQLVTKHLKVMEESQIVDTEKESSPYGPSRRVYSLAKKMSLALDIAPDLYTIRVTFTGIETARTRSNIGREYEDQFKSIIRKNNLTIEPFAELIAEVDEQIEELDTEREDLLKLRNIIMRKAKENILGRNIPIGERMIAYHYLDRNEKNAKKISRNLELRQEKVNYLLNRLRNESILQ
jgi:predicted transcriptional regulator